MGQHIRSVLSGIDLFRSIFLLISISIHKGGVVNSDKVSHLANYLQYNETKYILPKASSCGHRAMADSHLLHM